MAALSLVAALPGCALWRPATVPLRVIAEPARCAVPADTLLVLLPGSYSRPEEFQREGLVQALRDRQVAADIVLVDAHVGYYQNRSIVTRLADDVIGPARAKGYRRIWVAGISIGGVGGMLYANARPGEIDGLVLIAPYLGTQLTAQEIRRAGGLAAWRPTSTFGPSTENDTLDATLWPWLQAQTAAAAPAGSTVPIFLGYGRDDRFAYNDHVLADALPPPHVFTTDGGHDWAPWATLWRSMLERLPLPVDPSCARR